MLKKILPLSLLLLAGCFDSSCCKKGKPCKPTTKKVRTATPQQRCNHAGCTHDHNKDVDDEPAVNVPAIQESKPVIENSIENNKK